MKTKQMFNIVPLRWLLLPIKTVLFLTWWRMTSKFRRTRCQAFRAEMPYEDDIRRKYFIIERLADNSLTIIMKRNTIKISGEEFIVLLTKMISEYEEKEEKLKEIEENESTEKLNRFNY